MKIVVIGGSGLRGGRPGVGGPDRRRAAEGLSRRTAGITDTHKEQLDTDLLEFLNPTNERAADESRHVHA